METFERGDEKGRETQSCINKGYAFTWAELVTAICHCVILQRQRLDL